MPASANISEQDWNPPQAYLIGAAKAGTTSLAAWLAQHPAISVSRPKEPDFYTGNWGRGWAWYRERFDSVRRGRYLLDASTSYSMAPILGSLSPHKLAQSKLNDVPWRIFEARPDAVFIYILRDPVDRAYSNYWHARRQGYEKRSLLDASTSDSLYIRGSLYSHQIEKYMEVFPISRFLFIDFRELKCIPENVMEKCCSFLNIDNMGNGDFREINQSYLPNALGKVAWNLFDDQNIGDFSIKNLFSRLPKPVRSYLRSALTRPLPSIRDHERGHLMKHLRDEYMRAADLTGIDFSSPGK